MEVRALLLLLAIISQMPVTPVRVAGVQQIPSGEIATLTATNATEPLTWSIYQLVPVKVYKNEKTLVFTRPPGLYLVWLDAANGSSSWRIQFTKPDGPQPIPNPGPEPSPTPQPIPKPPQPGPQPQPQPDPDSGFIYPSEFSSAVVSALEKGPRCSPEDAASLSTLYRQVARQIEIDGHRGSPGWKTLDSATQFLNEAEATLLKSATKGKLTALKQAFPEVSKVAREEFLRRTQGQAGNTFTSETRSAYVTFLQQLAAGFDRAGPQ